jgi:mevalonate kinase
LTGKILLFGEYAVLQGSAALALPYPAFGGNWAWSDAPKQESLPEWAQFLLNLQHEGQLLVELDLARFVLDLQNGLFFDSNIPIGYGLGSSGALCAAFYATYAQQPLSPDDVAAYPRLKTLFAQLESFFHGSSSGADPLICYLNRPLRLEADGRILSVPTPPWPQSPYRFFLLDTQVPRSTGPLVRQFFARCENPDYAARIRRELNPLSEKAIVQFGEGDWLDLFQTWRQLSETQAQLLPEMIPDHCLGAWLQGLRGEHYALKLCGAGGGGFLLGMCKADFDFQAKIAQPCRAIE